MSVNRIKTIYAQIRDRANFSIQVKVLISNPIQLNYEVNPKSCFERNKSNFNHLNRTFIPIQIWVYPSWIRFGIEKHLDQVLRSNQFGIVRFLTIQGLDLILFLGWDGIEPTSLLLWATCFTLKLSASSSNIQLGSRTNRIKIILIRFNP